MKKKIVYTAIFGGYDELKAPRIVSEDWDYVCFTDAPSMKSDVWDVRLIDRHELGLMGVKRTDDPRALGKFFKIKPYLIFPDCDESLWIDGSVLIIDDIDKFISKHSHGSDMLCFRHSARNCIYEEAKAVLALGYAGKGEVDAQIKEYRDDGYPEHNGLIAGGLLYRKHTEKLIRIMNFWYEENMRKTLRDQLSFDYCAWKLNFTYDGISDQTYYANDYFKFIPHSARTVLAKLYLKTGRIPFSEGTEVTRNIIVKISMPFELSFDLDEQNTGFTDVRFDPCEVKSKIKITSATLIDTDRNSERLDFSWSSGEKENDRYVFDKNHKPMFFYKIKNSNTKIRSVIFTGEIDFQT